VNIEIPIYKFITLLHVEIISKIYLKASGDMVV